jgi:hypothetical protein
MQVVNGFVCQSCSDVDMAKRGIDPAHPEDDPKSPKYDPQAAQARKDPAVVFSGALAGLEAAWKTTPSDQQRPQPATGALVNLSA